MKLKPTNCARGVNKMANSKQQRVVLFSLLILFSVALTACAVASASDEEIEGSWESSAHADAESRSFTRWNDEDPPEIPANCAKCHSTHGYLDFLGADGSSPGQVDQPAPLGTTIECEACHNDVTKEKDSAVVPSGLKLTDLGKEASCIECHQGRASSLQLNEAIEGLPPDALHEDLSMPNIHNNPAGATFHGTLAKGGGEYPNQSYMEQFYHNFDTCISCHDAHTLQVRVENCSACHLGANTIEAVRDIRLSNVDYDGDGDTTEGISGEIETMAEKLLLTIRLYPLTAEGVEAIEFDGRFVDQAGENYATWTPRLLQAAYNYQYADKDPGSYSHNPRYIVQLLYDSISDLGGSTRGMTRP
jgi:hypothetical protein